MLSGKWKCSEKENNYGLITTFININTVTIIQTCKESVTVSHSIVSSEQRFNAASTSTLAA